ITKSEEWLGQVVTVMAGGAGDGWVAKLKLRVGVGLFWENPVHVSVGVVAYDFRERKRTVQSGPHVVADETRGRGKAMFGAADFPARRIFAVKFERLARVFINPQIAAEIRDPLIFGDPEILPAGRSGVGVAR